MTGLQGRFLFSASRRLLSAAGSDGVGAAVAAPLPPFLWSFLPHDVGSLLQVGEEKDLQRAAVGYQPGLHVVLGFEFFLLKECQGDMMIRRFVGQKIQ